MTLLGVDRSEAQAEAERLEQTIEGVLRRIVTRTGSPAVPTARRLGSMPQQNSISIRELSGSSAGKSGFRILAAISSVLFLSLGCVWMFAPGLTHEGTRPDAGP